MFNSMRFERCIYLWNSQHNRDTYCHQYQKLPCAHCGLSPFNLIPQGTSFFSVTMNKFAFSKTLNGKMWYVDFCFCLVSPGVLIILRFFDIVCISVIYLFVITSLLYYWWSLECFQVLVIMKKTAMDICVDIFLWTCFHFSEVNNLGVELLCHGVDGIFNFRRNCQTAKWLYHFIFPLVVCENLFHILINTW